MTSDQLVAIVNNVLAQESLSAFDRLEAIRRLVQCNTADEQAMPTRATRGGLAPNVAQEGDFIRR